jgi:hypothetical protein
MAKRKRYGTGFGTTSTPGDVLRRKNRRYNKHRNPRAALQRLMRDKFGIDIEDMTMDVGGDIDIEEILAEIIPPDNERRANANRQARLAKIAQALKAPRQMMDIEKERVSMPPRQMPLTSGSVSRPKGRNLIPYPEGVDPRVGSSIDSSSLRLGLDEVIPEQAAPYAPPPDRVPPKKGVSLPRVSRDERAARIAYPEGADPRVEALLESSTVRRPGDPPIVRDEEVEVKKSPLDAILRDKLERMQRHPAIAPVDSEMDEPVRGYYVDSQMDEPVMDDSVSVESFMDEPIDAYDPNTVMQPEDLDVDYGFDIEEESIPPMSTGTEQAEQMITIDKTTDETMERLPGLYRSHQHEDSGSRVSVNPVKKMEESWYDAEGNKTNRLGRTIDNFFRGIFGGEEAGGEESPWGILPKASMEGYEDKPWLAKGGMVRKKYRKGGKVKFNSGGTVGWGRAIQGHNLNRDITKKCDI